MPFRKRDGSVPFSGKHSEANAAPALFSLQGHRAYLPESTSCQPRTRRIRERQTGVPLPRTRQLEIASCLPSISAIPAVLAGHQMVGELPTCLWFAFHTGLVPRATAPTAKTTRNARDSRSFGPISSYISIGLLSAAAQDEHGADQDAEKESCFHLMLIPCLIAGRMRAFLLITYQ